MRRKDCVAFATRMSRMRCFMIVGMLLLVWRVRSRWMFVRFVGGRLGAWLGFGGVREGPRGRGGGEFGKGGERGWEDDVW